MKVKISLLAKDKESFLQFTESTSIAKNLKLIVDMNNNIKRLETKIDKLETIISTHCDNGPVIDQPIDQPIVPVNDPIIILKHLVFLKRRSLILMRI